MVIRNAREFENADDVKRQTIVVPLRVHAESRKYNLTAICTQATRYPVAVS